MDTFQGTGNIDISCGILAERFDDRQQQDRPDALPASHKAVIHGFI
jgi:hypothetical protein